ncbi:hypothetical protein LCGC14_2882030, partial [marine sediment metagenome]
AVELLPQVGRGRDLTAHLEAVDPGRVPLP